MLHNSYQLVFKCTRLVTLTIWCLAGCALGPETSALTFRKKLTNGQLAWTMVEGLRIEGLLQAKRAGHRNQKNCLQVEILLLDMGQPGPNLAPTLLTLNPNHAPFMHQTRPNLAPTKVLIAKMREKNAGPSIRPVKTYPNILHRLRAFLGDKGSFLQL